MKKTKNQIALLLLLIFTGCGEVTKLGNNSIDDTNTNVDVDIVNSFINREKCNQIIDNEFIKICYDYKLKGAKAVSYTLDGDLVNETNIVKRPNFYAEKSLDKKYRIYTTDYTNSGYDRGHLAPDASFDWSQESLNAVYTLANIIPQAPQVNRNMWSKLEKFARDKAVELGELDVINVVKYSKNSKKIGEHKMSVSRGFYKMLYNNNLGYQECFYYSNRLNLSARDDSVDKHKVSCAEVAY